MATFLDTHVKPIVGLDSFTVPTVAFHLLFLIGIEQVLIAARSPWQNPCAERGIGSIRRECLDHVIVLNERHLRRILRGYFTYYRESRTRLAPAKNSPQPCEFEPRGAFIPARRGCWQAQGAQVLGKQRGRGFRWGQEWGLLGQAVAESFLSSLKKERIKKHTYRSRELAVSDVADYIDAFYNRARRHSHLGGLSPEKFEAAQKPPRRSVH